MWWLLVPDRLVWVLHKLLIYWDFYSQPSIGLKEKVLGRRKYPVSCRSPDELTLLMPEVRGKGPDWFRPGGKASNLEENWLQRQKNTPRAAPVGWWQEIEATIRKGSPKLDNGRLEKTLTHCLFGANSLKNVSSILLNLCAKEFQQFCISWIVYVTGK